MKAQKIAITAGTGILFLLCLAGLWVAYGAYHNKRKVEDTLDGARRKLETIYNQNPFPNPTNTAVLRGDTAWMTNWYQSLVGDLRAAAAPTETLTPSGFIKKLQDTTGELQKKAAADGGKVLPDGFAFGFGRYLGSNSDMPAPENVKRLAIQFAMVEAVTREILDSRVDSISRIDREEFETPAADRPATATPGGRPAHRLAAPVAPEAALVVAAPASRYPRQRFTFSFAADEKALAEVLNRMARLPLCVVVTEVQVQRSDVSRGLRIEADKAKAATLLPSQRVVSGPEVGRLLKTQMQIDIYTFEGV